MKRTSTALIVVAACLLLAIAAFHATGHSFVAREIEASSVAPFVKSAVPTLWLFFSWHLTAVALASGAALFAAHENTRRAILGGCAIIVVVDFVWVFTIAGWFPGTVLLLLASALLIAGGVLTSRHPTQ